jgi:site-specific recombinase XerD
MAKLHHHARHGFKIVYDLHFRDGDSIRKYRYHRDRKEAHIIHQDVERLETLSARGRLDRDDILRALHAKYITKEEAARLVDRHICTDEKASWDQLETHYLRHMQTHGSPITLRRAKYKIRPGLKYLRDMQYLDPESVTVEHIRKFVSWRRRTVAKATVNKELNALRIAFDCISGDGKAFRENPARLVPSFDDLPTRMPAALHPEQLTKIIAAIDLCTSCKGYFPELIWTYLLTGMRRYELLTLEYKKVDIAGGKIRVIGKGNKERIIDMHPKLRNEVFPMVIQKNTERKNHGRYFFGGKDTPIMTDDAMSKSFRMFLIEHGLYDAEHGGRGPSIHTLRHTFISYLIDSGESIKKVQELAGHARMTTTLRYTHAVPSAQRAIDKLDYEKYMTQPQKNTEKTTK